MQSPVYNVLTSPEVDMLYGKADGTTRKKCQKGEFAGQARKAIRVWIIEVEAVERVFGPLPTNYFEQYELGGDA